MYRPEFPYATPEGFDEEPFEYWFDSHTVPALGTTFSSGTKVLNIPLKLDPDAEFFWRGIKVFAPARNFMVRFRDGFGNYLSEFVPVSTYTPSPTPAQPPLGSPPVVLEPEVPCPAGTVIYIDIVEV